YPHAYRDHWVAQQYLPNALQGRVFYQPSPVGYEGHIQQSVMRRREEQLAAMLEGGCGAVEVLTYGPLDRESERWLARTISNAAQELAIVRERLFAALAMRRHDLVLDLHAGTGLLTWEALRRAPEGGVWALCRDAEAALALRQQAEALAELTRPTVLQGRLAELPVLLAAADHGDVRFDAGRGRNSVVDEPDKGAAAALLAGLLRPGGALSLAEAVPRHAQRLYALVDLAPLGDELAAALGEAEEAIYRQADDPMVNWDAEDLADALRAAGLEVVALNVAETASERLISDRQLARWFERGAGPRPSYADHLARRLTAEQVDMVQDLYRRNLLRRTVPWRGRVAYLAARRCP
ncbi:MAG: AAA family ATPase, partial [Chloroflexota bacterium]